MGALTQEGSIPMFGIDQYGKAYRDGSLTPSQVAADHIDYAKVVSRECNAISVLNPKAMEMAEASTRRFAQGNEKGPLDGVPVVVKDSYHVKGLRRWHGSAIHDGDAPSSFSSEPICKLEAAGAVIIAKTTMPDMGMLGSGISSQFGIVRNPWDLSKSPGGSSSGVGASLSSGLAAFGLGTDIAGSVRLPAGHCGLAAIKPTQERIAYSPASQMRSSGVLARSVADVEQALECVGTSSESDPWSLPGAFKAKPAGPILDRKPKVGLLLDMGYGTPLDPVVARFVTRAAERLTRMGCQVEPIPLDLTDKDFSNADRVFKAHAVAEIRSSSHPEAVLDYVAEWVKEAERLSMADYEDALNGVLGTACHVTGMTERFDYLISPVIPVTGFDADSPGPGDEEQLLHHTQFTAWFNQTCQPAAVYCEGVDDATRLPVGVQIVAKRFDDAGALAIAGILERTRPEQIDYPHFEEVPEYDR